MAGSQFWQYASDLNHGKERTDAEPPAARLGLDLPEAVALTPESPVGAASAQPAPTAHPDEAAS